MIELTRRLQRTEPPVQSQASVRLVFDLRQKSRLRTRLESGEDAWLELQRGEILRGGDLLLATDGRVVEVIAQPESLLHVECGTPQGLTRAAYHLGNRHVPVQTGDGYLRLACDHVLQQMLEGLGARVSVIEAPFEPEAGAYAPHAHAESKSQKGRIHEYGSRRREP